MFKFIMSGVFVLMLATPFTSNTANGATLFQPGGFPHGKMLKVDGLTSLPTGKWQQTVYLIDPIEFKDSGTPDGKDGYVYTGKINHTLVGGLFVSVTNSAAANAVFKITIPYNTPLHNGSVYKFTSSDPLTVLSKETQLDSNAKQFAIYNCIVQGYLTINDKKYPAVNK